MDARLTYIEETIGSLLPEGRFIVEPVGADWVASILNPEGEALELGRGETALEAAEAAQRQVFMSVGAVSLISGVLGYFRRDKERPADSARFDWAAVTQPIQRSGAADLIRGFGWRLVFEAEPEGTYRWWVYDSDGGLLHDSGQSDEWDDAKLDSIIDFPPPSDEQ